MYTPCQGSMALTGIIMYVTCIAYNTLPITHVMLVCNVTTGIKIHLSRCSLSEMEVNKTSATVVITRHNWLMARYRVLLF